MNLMMKRILELTEHVNEQNAQSLKMEAQLETCHANMRCAYGSLLVIEAYLLLPCFKKIPEQASTINRQLILIKKDIESCPGYLAALEKASN